jgi:Zn ribbon nucleic-acid-binding protein
MALVKRGKYWYGDEQADIRAELLRYSRDGYPAEHFADAICACGTRIFRLQLDEEAGVAVRTCAACGHDHSIGDSADFLDEAELEQPECLCGGSEFEITVGVALYDDGEAVKWLYLGCRCPSCGCTGCYGDWKNEYEDYREFLTRV